MVLDVWVDGCKDRMSCRYAGFTKFRTEILRGWNEELGKLYEQKFKYLFDENTDINYVRNILIDIIEKRPRPPSELDMKISEILDKYDRPYNIGMKIFAYHSYCDGKIMPYESRLVLDSFKRVDPEKFDKSNEDDNEWYRECYDTWIKMLNYSIEHNKDIIFG